MKRINLLEALSDNILVDPDKCIFCGECVDICVLDNLRLKLAPCRAACPLDVNCQGYVQLIKRGDDEKAFEVLTRNLPFPGILGRVCPAPCEDACTRKEQTGEAVAIKTLKRYLDEQQGGDNRPLPQQAEPCGGKVAIVGSGPAGMMAAHELALAGREVTIFESESEPGGMLRWAIPSFKLPSDRVAAEFERLERLGVSVKCNAAMGEGNALDKLKSEFDAVIIAVGCSEHATLPIEGRDLDGVFYGLPFLKQARSDNMPGLSGKVVVIGGGNVAVDAAQTAVRLGADSVTVVSLEAGDEMPAFPDAIAAAQADGIDFLHSWGPTKIDGSEGAVSGVQLQRCLRAFDDAGKFDPQFDSCMINVLEADAVIIAIGQKRQTASLAGSTLAGMNPGETDPLTLATADAKVFVAGDFVSGPTTVVSAMASGKRAAESVNRFLNGEHLGYGRAYPGPIETEYDIDYSKASAAARVKPAFSACKGQGDFSETVAAIDTVAARREAERCYSCGGPFGKFRTCWFCLPCEVECPQEAIWVEIPYLLR